jgi:biopolymer transport protein TolR
MGMNVSGKKGGAMGDINVTPLVDVVLVLLIIFMVITQMLSSGMDVKLPTSKTAEEVRDVGQYLVLSIKPPLQVQEEIPQVFIDRDSIEFDGMAQTILDSMNENNATALLIKGSQDLRWKQAYKIMSTISDGGLSKMLLATDKEK